MVESNDIDIDVNEASTESERNDNNHQMETFATVSPVRKKYTRKRKCDPTSWKKNTRKRLKLMGEEHVSTRGKHVAAKSMKTNDCSKCRYKCNSKVTT